MRAHPSPPEMPQVPLDFLKRKGKADKSAEAVKPAAGLMPEEVLAQDHLLKLYYAGKSSEGVRMKAGPAAVRELPSMLVGLARSEIERTDTPSGCATS